MAKKKVVVLGAGYFGSQLARSLDAQAGKGAIELTVVDRREAMVHKMGALRGAVDAEQWAKKVVVPRHKMLKHGKIVNEDVSAVTESEVTLGNGETLPFDVCVVATGAHNRSPGEPGPEVRSKADLTAFFENAASVFAASKDVVIVGGGVVGVELAGEIKATRPGANVTVVHSGDTLISASTPALKPSVSKNLKKQLEGMGVSVLLGQRAQIDMSEFAAGPMLSGERVLRTSKGEELKADLVVLATGTTPNTGALPAGWKSDKGLVHVNEHLQVRNQGALVPNVFAIGDVVEIAENHQAAFARFQVPVAAKNITAFLQGKAKLPKAYKAHPKAMLVITVGPKKGYAQTPVGTLGPWLVSKVKGGSLFSPMAWKECNGLSVPK